MSLTLDEYQKAAIRTARPTEEYKCPELEKAVLGLGISGEAGEVADYLKKVVGHDHPLDKNKLRKELGDVLWYAAAIAERILEEPLSHVAQVNIDKLTERYPEKFEVNRSLNRAEGDI